MGNAILDVVLGLVLIYAVMALLVTKVQELVDGNVLRGRAWNLHALVLEAVGKSEDLKNKVLANPLIFALYEQDSAKQHYIGRTGGPTAIPPELFARVLLIELNDGKHPSDEFATPSAFLTGKAPQKDPPRIWKVLGGLLAGREGNWADFTTAVADWYSAIGDRSEGWFKRRAQWWSFWVAFILAGSLNVDSLHIAKTLSQDSALREGLADIAERVAEQRASEATGQTAVTPKPAALAPIALAPEDVATARLTDAIHSLTDAVALDKKGGFATFEVTGLDPDRVIKPKLKDEDPCFFPAGNPTDLLKGKDVQNLTTKDWLYLLPRVRTAVEEARTQDRSSVARTTYINAHRCLSHLSSWLAVAESFASTDAVRRSARDATVAVEQAKSALLRLVEQRATFPSLGRSYQADPEAVLECRSVATTPSEFSACVEQALKSRVRLPFLFLPTTMNLQFCKVTTTTNDRFPPSEWPCNAPPLSAKDSIGIPNALYLTPREGSLFWPWLAGILVTTLFVALGAPFWFDVLGRVVKLRAAGRVRDGEAAAARAGGKTPPPAVGANVAPPRAEPPGPATGPFADSRNNFEDGLVARDIVALQQALTTVAPGLQATSRLDTPTRSAIAAWCKGNNVVPPTEELSRELYQRIVGRDAIRTPAAPASTGLRLGQTSSQNPDFAKKLMTVLNFPGRIADAENRFRFDAELRALAVLYRYKRDTKPSVDREVFDLAKSNPSSLNEVDAKLLDEILKLPSGTPYAREVQPWLDLALGELGQVEVGAPNRANSNQRICEYLDAAVPGTGDHGDATAWCGAFVAWVLKKYLAAPVPGAPTLPGPVTAPLTAANWAAWGNPRGGTEPGAVTSAVAGDIIVFKPKPGSSSSGHVAFFIANDPTTGKVWALGGNQNSGTQVFLSPFSDPVMAVRCV